MCIVVDTNVIPSVFNPQSADHQEFQPVFAWIAHGRGKMVYGGTKYIEELNKFTKYNSLLAELRRIRKIVLVDKASVDSIQEEVSQKIKHKDFNDQHIIAIVIVSGCKLVCSNDKKSYPFVKKKSLYPNGAQRPKIYSSRRHTNLLTDKYIAKCCYPC